MERAMTVFIADNTEEFTASLTAALQRSEGFQVVGSASDGEQAIREIRERRPDILVLDLMLSKLDGFSVLKAIASMERKPITLATSAFVSDFVSAAAVNLGVSALLKDRILCIVEQITAKCDMTVADVDILPESEKELIIHTFNDTAVDYPSDKCVHQLFEEVAANIPDEIATLRERVAPYAIQEEDLLSLALFEQVAVKFFEARKKKMHHLDDNADAKNGIHSI